MGLLPWSDEFPCIDFTTDAGVVDLHNNARIEQLKITPSAATLTLVFLYADNWREIEVRGRLVELEFGGIRDLNLKLPGDYNSLAALTLEGIVHRTVSSQSYFDLDMGDIQCSLAADSLTLRGFDAS